MRVLKLCMATLLAVSVVGMAGCAAKSNTGNATPQTAKVQRGNIVVSTTSTGNLAFTQSEDVAFDMAGTVQEVTCV